MVPKRVLIIDDEPGIRRIVQIALQAILGWEVQMAASGQEGLAIAQTTPLDGILLDVMMPGMNGPETLELLRAQPTTQAIPVILLTAKAQASEQEQLQQLDVTGIITKPFKAPELAAQLQALLSSR